MLTGSSRRPAAGAVFAASHADSTMLPDTLASDPASLSVAAHLGMGNPSGEGCVRGGQVDLQYLAGSQVHRDGGAEFGAVGEMDLDPDLAEDVAGGVLHGAHEGIGARVVVEEEAGAAADRVEGVIGARMAPLPSSLPEAPLSPRTPRSPLVPCSPGLSPREISWAVFAPPRSQPSAILG